MKRHVKAASAGSTSDGATSLGPVRRAFVTRGASLDAEGSGAPSGRLHLAFLAAVLAAFLLIPAAQAFAGTVTVNLTGTASGTVTSNNGSPPINCSIKAGVVTGVCTTYVVDDFSFTPTIMTATPAADSSFAGWTVAGGTCSGFVNPCSLPAITFFIDYNLTAEFAPPPEPPLTITDDTGAGVEKGLVTLNGRVNPGGAPLNECRFLYGTTTEYGESAPCHQTFAAIGEGNSEVPVTASTEPLEPDTTYHFRLRTGNIGGVAQGKDSIFTTPPAGAESCPNAAIRAEQGIAALKLPDCMALEQVSPSEKGNQHARIPIAISADDKRVLFNSVGTLSDAPNVQALGGDTYLGTRGTSGWSTEGANALLASIPSPNSPLQIVSSFSPDLSTWLDFTPAGVFQRQSGGNLSRLSPSFPPAPGEKFASADFQGASADRSHVFLRTERSKRTDTFLPGDPVPSDGGLEGVSSSEDYNVYIARLDAGGNPTLELLARDRDGKAWGGNCGARLGGAELTTGLNLNLANGQRNQGAISADGSHVYFSTRPAQPSTGDCTNANRKRIMERVETPTGPVISELIASECDRVAPACSTDDGDDLYQGASIDQSKVYFTTNRQLADSDLDATSSPCVEDLPQGPPLGVVGCDLYLYDRDKPAGQRLTQVSAGEDLPGQHEVGNAARVVNSITAISADGSRVYFVALGVLTDDPNPEGAVALEGEPNLYTWDTESETTAFIGTLASSFGLPSDNDGGFNGSGLWGSEGTWRNGAYPVPILGKDSSGNEVGGDGHILLFRSQAPLTADDGDGTVMDVYRYDADADALVRISKAAPGGSDDGAFEATVAASLSPVILGTDYAERARRVSEDGETIAFATTEALLPGDNNGVEDAYMWRRGKLYRLPGSARVKSQLLRNAPIVSGDGTTVAWHGVAQLLPSDGDSAQDVYVARVNGGFPTVRQQVCTPDGGDGCQGAPVPPPSDTGTASSSISGKGNVRSGAKPTSKRCPKGKRKVKNRCVSRKASKHAKKHRAAGADRGAGR